MKETLTRKNIPFTMVANNVLKDPKLSMKAKGLFSYIYSKPDKWEFSAERISAECSDGVDSVQNGLKELEARGYLLRQRKSNGRVTYYATFQPKRENPIQVKHLKGEIPSISKTEEESKKDKESNTVVAVATSKKTPEYKRYSMEQINDFIMLFRGLNPTITKVMGRKAEREAAMNLLDEHDYQWWANFLPKYFLQLRVDKYCPRATTPWKMEDKLGEILAHISSLKVEAVRGPKVTGKGIA